MDKNQRARLIFYGTFVCGLRAMQSFSLCFRFLSLLIIITIPKNITGCEELIVIPKKESSPTKLLSVPVEVFFFKAKLFKSTSNSFGLYNSINSSFTV